MKDKIYAIEVSPYYLKSLRPIRFTTNFKEARTYSTIGPARAMKTRYENEFIFQVNSGSIILPCYIEFPKIREFLITEGDLIFD